MEMLLDELQEPSNRNPGRATRHDVVRQTCHLHVEPPGLLRNLPIEIGKVLHPSPQSPAANRGWAKAVEEDLGRYGITVP